MNGKTVKKFLVSGTVEIEYSLEIEVDSFAEAERYAMSRAVNGMLDLEEHNREAPFPVTIKSIKCIENKGQNDHE